MKEVLAGQARLAKVAARKLAGLSTEQKNSALLAMADALEKNQTEIIFVNAEDVAAAKENGIRANMIDRLTLTPERISAMAEGLRQTAKLTDPIGD